MSDSCAASAALTPSTPKTTIAGHLLNLFTGRDNQTLDLGRVSWGVNTLALLALAGWHEYLNTRVSLTELGTALGAVVLTHGVALGLKGKTEPGGAP
jgi:hypothetical protein